MLLPLALVALLVTVIEHTRGWALAPRDEQLRLRSLWRGWPAGAYGRFGLHEAGAMTRNRLRRSAVAQVVFLLCFVLAMAATAAMGWPFTSAGSPIELAAAALVLLLALAALVGAALVVRSLAIA